MDIDILPNIVDIYILRLPIIGKQNNNYFYQKLISI